MNQTSSLMYIRSSGTGKLSVYLQQRFMRPETDSRVTHIILSKTNCKFPKRPRPFLRVNRQLHVNPSATDSLQPRKSFKHYIFVTHFAAPKFFQFPDRSLVQSPLFYGQFSGKAHLTKPDMIRIPEVAGIPILHPADHNPPAVRRDKRLGCIKDDSIINSLVMFILKSICLSVIVSDQA